MPGHQSRGAYWALRAVLACTTLCAASHAQVLIDPVVVELGAHQRAAQLTLTLNSTSGATLVLQADVLRWHQTLDGEARYERSQDLIVVPPIVELKPGESQLVRIAFRGTRHTAAEQAYRLILEDVSTDRPAPPAANQGISFRMRYDLPVMLGAMEAPRQGTQWTRCEGPPRNAQACVRLENNGNRRVTLRKLALRGTGWDLAIDHPGTVLAQSAREWRAPLPAGANAQMIDVVAETSRAEAINGQLAPP